MWLHKTKNFCLCAHIIFLLYTAALKDTLSESPFLVSLYFVEEIINLKKL